MLRIASLTALIRPFLCSLENLEVFLSCLTSKCGLCDLSGGAHGTPPPGYTPSIASSRALFSTTNSLNQRGAASSTSSATSSITLA